MVFPLTSFPIEIQEIILAKLSGQSLISASKVCKLWHNICEWIAKEKFAKIIPEECITEIEKNITSDNIWLQAVNYYILQLHLVNNMLDHKKNVVAELDENRHLTFCVFEPLIFVGCTFGEIEVYNSEQGSFPVLINEVLKKPIFHLEVMATMNLLLAKTGRNDLEFFSLPYFSGQSWVYEMTHLKPIFDNFTNDFHCEQNFSMCGLLLAVSTGTQKVTLFQVTKVEGEAINLKYMTHYNTDEPIAHISLWNDELIILLKSGGILCWKMSNQVSMVSERYHEIHYENPVWIFRGRIFCSTFISSQLLGFWHMNRGAEYWLIGKPSYNLIRCRDLGTMYSADTGIENVLCVCLKQRLLACGTKDGKVLLYYLSDKFFSSEEFDLNGNEHLREEFNRVPDLTIRTKERPIKNIFIQFSDNNIKIYTWPYMVSRKPGSRGLLQCIILEEGNWV